MSSGSLPFRSAGSMPGATRLYGDFLNAHERIAAYLGPRFDDSAALQALGRRLQSGHYPRVQLVRALGEFAAEAGAPTTATAQLDRLQSPEAVVVFAGQQPGLLTGPLYAIYKALTAERWATALSAQMALPVIPCYWLASDDHDLAEVDHIELPANRNLATVRYASPAIRPGPPVDRIILDAEIEATLRELAVQLPRSAELDEIFDALRQSYSPGTSFVTAFARLWYRMFPDSRLLFVSPSHPALRRAAAPLLQTAIRDDAALFSLYLEASERLEAAGYHRQVHKGTAQTLLFYQRNHRTGIRRCAGGGFAWDGASPLSAAQLCEAIHHRPEFFSANVLLRPIVQNALFPTVGVVLGPAETAYYAQLGGMHDHFAVPRPAIMPRTSVTLLEPRSAAALLQFGVDIAALGSNVEGAIARALEARLPPDLRAELARSAATVEAAFDAVKPVAHAFDPGMDNAVRTARKRANDQIIGLARRVRAIQSHREQDTEAEIRSLAACLWPRGKAQERIINIVYYWAKYGWGFLEELHRDWPVGEREHLIWELH